MADVLRSGTTTYRVMVEDIYDQGYYMLKSKYRFLRFSYACLPRRFRPGRDAVDHHRHRRLRHEHRRMPETHAARPAFLQPPRTTPSASHAATATASCSCCSSRCTC